ncbi:O-antigen ligase family protein [Oceanobacter antarcticus]|uniref:O-antigen ligase family protein n=1 Tax=Oceanobacter antarcticus TaxID=3133425 RepID=A0ABW8NEJ9_9GAMM
MPTITALTLVQLWVLIQIVSGMSLATSDSFVAFIKGMSLLVFFVNSLIILKDPRNLKLSVYVVIVSAGFQAAYGSFMVLSGIEYGFFIEKEHYRNVATGTFINRNHLASYLTMSISIGLGYILSYRDSQSRGWRHTLRNTLAFIISDRFLIRLVLISLAIGLVLTKSRMGNASFLASLTAASFIALILMKPRPHLLVKLVVSLIIIDIAIVGVFFGFDKIAQRIADTSSETEYRDEMNESSFAMWKDNPLLGTGAGSFAYVFPQYKVPEYKTQGTTMQAHNDYLQFLAEYGLPAFIALVFIVINSLRHALIAMKSRKSDLHRGMGFAALMGILAMAVHALSDFNLQIPANAFMFIFILTLAHIARFGSSSKN